MRKKAAPSVPEDNLSGPDPPLSDGVVEFPHGSDITPTDIGPLPGDRYPTPQPEEIQHAKSHRAKKKKPHQEGQEPELRRPPGPSSDQMDLAREPEDSKIISSKASGDSSNPPGREIIDLTVKEESRSATPISPAQAPESNEDPADLKAGWVCPANFRSSCTNKKTEVVPTSKRHIMFHGYQTAIFHYRSGDPCS